MSQGQFKTDQAWDAIVEILQAQILKTDIAPICDRDFSENGEIVMQPPSIRVLFDGETASATSDSQRLSYLVDGRFIVLCADQDLTDIFAQGTASLLVVNAVKSVLIGARLQLEDGDVSEPLMWTSTLPWPVDGLGVAYAVGFIVPGLAQFPGTNATPGQVN